MKSDLTHKHFLLADEIAQLTTNYKNETKMLRGLNMHKAKELSQNRFTYEHYMKAINRVIAEIQELLK